MLAIDSQPFIMNFDNRHDEFSESYFLRSSKSALPETRG